jgi:nucleotide-binding universal stress UspA family protein
MGQFLIILTPARGGSATIAKAIADLALEEDTHHVTLAYVVDDTRSAHLQDCLSNRGFVGSEPSEDVRRIAIEQAVAAGEARLAEAQSALERADIEVTSQLVHGSVVDFVLKRVQETTVNRVYMSRSRLGPLARLFGEKETRQLKQVLGATLVAIEEPVSLE